MSALGDGRYDVFVVDFEEHGKDGVIELELTITTGDHKGEVVRVNASKLQRDPIALLGLPGSMVVAEGQPSVTFE
jgi:carotenoid cleavage dioxygenase-like enzyme